LELQQNNVEVKPVELHVQMGYVVANLGGVAAQRTTVRLAAKANANQLAEPHPPLLAAAMSAASSAPLFSTNCLNIGTMRDVRATDSTHTMLSSLLHDLLVALAQMVMLIHVKGRLLLSWLKPLTRPQVRKFCFSWIVGFKCKKDD
jgi:hypothetical protein